MIFLITVLLFLLIGIPVVYLVLKNLSQNQGVSDGNMVSDDGGFYASSASERYGASLDSSDSNDTTTCNDNVADASPDSGSCDGSSDGGSSSD